MKQFVDKNPRLLRLLKILLLPLVCGFIIFKLFYAYDIDRLAKEVFFDPGSFRPVYLVLAFILMPLNWLLETRKWQLLVMKFEPISFLQSMKAVVSGITLSMITPNQIGDFAGRVVHLKTLNKLKGSLITVIGHSAQLLTTTLLGMYALIYFLTGNVLFHKFSSFIIPLYLAISGLMCYSFIRFANIYEGLKRFRWIRKIDSYTGVFMAYNRSELFIILMLSMVRYAVFVSQYYLLLLCFGVNIPFVTALGCIVATFCIQSVVPSFFLLEMGLRGASALLFFSVFSQNSAGILLSAYSLWIINIMMPALAGLVFLLRLKPQAS